MEHEGLGTELTNAVSDFAEEALGEVVKAARDDVRRGGYLCIARRVDGQAVPLLIMLVGTLPEEKRVRCFELCQEKAARLAAHPDHVSSWQTRNVDVTPKLYGGAILTDQPQGDIIISFSGLVEKADEALALHLAGGLLDLITEVRYQEIIAISDNEIARRMDGEG